MRAIRWRSGSGELVGYFHPRQNSDSNSNAPAQHAVLICNPFGQEALRAYRMLRVLADRLAREGHDVLRFDYRGAGDASGDCEEFALESAVQDILSANAELSRLSVLPKRTWIGLRLGASLAVRAAARCDRNLTSMLLWDPVIAGAGYLDEIARTHVSYVERSLGETWEEHVKNRGLQAAEPPQNEAFGFVVTPELRSEMNALRIEQDIGALDGIVLGWMSAARPPSSLIQVEGYNWFGVPERDAWNSDEAVFSARIPQEFLVVCDQWLKS